ncbi:MAG: hypothetical protein JO004_00905 [Methylobacteriaceae bacterium]|nr:hypothetical protein [Methylobacteriaceae bacterium]
MSDSETTDRRIPPSFAEFPARSAPAASPPVERAPQAGAPVSTPHQSVFAADTVGAPDTLSPALARLAELALHRGAETPVSIGLLGGPGSGKSSALAALVRRIEALIKAAAAGGPYLSHTLVLQVSGHELADEPEAVLATRLHQALERQEPAFARESAADAVHSTSDPRALAHAANERLDEARRRLDTERQALEDVSSRRARLIDTVLYESAGSQVDAYARARRSGIESALRSFGIAGPDPIRAYKDEVNGLAQRRGGSSRAGLALRSLYAYRGQTRWLVLAVIFLACAWGFAYLERDHTWLDSIRGSGETARPVADWLQAHLTWLATLRTAAIGIAILCVLVNLWRAFRFVQPVSRGATLLDRDVAQRGQDLDSRLSHQTRRVDNLARDVDALAARAAEMEKRAGSDAGGAAAVDLLPFHASASDRIGIESARAFFASVSNRLAQDGASSGLRRIVIAIDGVEAAASTAIESIAALLARPGFAAIITADPARIGADRLARIVQVPFTVAPADHAALVDRLLGRAAVPAAGAEPMDARHSALDTPVSEGEAELLAALAPLAGPSPRGVKRFVNLYRLARLDAPDELAPLAFMLALDAGGSAGEIAAVEGSLAGSDERALFILQHSAGTRLAAGLSAAEQAEGKKLTHGSMRRARDVARMWSFGKGEGDAF